MIERRAPGGAEDDPGAAWDGELSPADAASYIAQMSREMASLAAANGLTRLASALDVATGIALDASRRNGA
jgi:hypothetical protein